MKFATSTCNLKHEIYGRAAYIETK